MYNPNNYLAQVVWTFFVCQQIAFCSCIATWLSLNFRRYLLIFEDLIESRHKVPLYGLNYKQLVSPLYFLL